MASLFGASPPPSWSAASVSVSKPSPRAPSVSAPSSRSAESSLTFGVSVVDSTGPGSFRTVGAATAFLSSATSSSSLSVAPHLAVYARLGKGTVVLVASPAPLQDRMIERADNAAFAIDIAGTRGVSVAFDEYDHGYGRTGSGVGGLPPWWKAGLLIALCAAAVWMASASRRFGPPQRSDRSLAPSRIGYVDAVATLLSTAPHDRIGPLASPMQRRAREALCRRVGIAMDAPDDEIERTAAVAGIPSELVRATLSQPRNADDFVRTARASSELARTSR